MNLDTLREVAREFTDEPAIIWHDVSYSYGWLFDRVDNWLGLSEFQGIQSGRIVAIEGDFSPNSVALLLALIERSCVIVPLTESVSLKKQEFLRISDAEFSVHLSDADEMELVRLSGEGDHVLYEILRERNHPGLVLFSSGSTGESKAAVHDVVPLLTKFETRRRRMRMISFLLFDHIGGINTMLYSLFNGGAIVVIDDRSPETVLRAIARHEVETLPTSPTFINLLLLSQTYQNYDLSSLKTVTYGTEPMPESTLRRFNELFPEIRLQQTYGLSELGILQSRSKASDSLWVKIGGEGVEIRVVDGILHIKSVSVMLGYLNAESPFTSDGWFDTGDVVTVDGEYMLIHGRESEIINVGGEKVYPTEVESIIQEMESVQEVTVYGEKNAIIGNVVCAVVRPLHGVESTDLPDLVKRHCAGRLERFKVPLKVTVDTASQHGERFKKSRANLVDQR